MPQLIKQLPNPSGLLSKNCNFKGIGQLEQSRQQKPIILSSIDRRVIPDLAPEKILI